MLLRLYRWLTGLAGPLLPLLLRHRVRRGREDRTRLSERLGHAGRVRPDGRLVWLHGASVGEAQAALPLIRGLLDAAPDLHVLITTGTVTSAGLIGQRLPARAIHQYVPLDQPRAWQRFLDHWRPSLAVLIESELWPNLIHEVAGRQTPLALVNARLSPRSFRRWRRFPGAARALLRRFALCLAQSEQDAARLRALGAAEVRVSGNLKLAAAPLEADPDALERLRRAIGERPVWLAASTHPGEEEQLFEVHRRLLVDWPEALLVLVPRHPHRGAQLMDLAGRMGLKVALRSAGRPPDRAAPVYVADTLGELGLFFRLVPFALIGGSLVPHGGQNPLEAARLGCVPVFGPHTHNFEEVTAALEQRNAAVRVADAEGLERIVREVLTGSPRLERLRTDARTAAASEASSLRITLDALLPLLDHAPRRHHAPARVLG